MESGMTIHLRIWRQPNGKADGKLVDYTIENVSPDMSFLEMLDVLNSQIIGRGEIPIEFDSDCREGICGSCGIVIDGVAHGPVKGTATCQLHMRHFHDGDRIVLEPWRANAFPIIKDLVVDRSALDSIIIAGGYISVHTGAAREANANLVGKYSADKAMDAAACIGCGACVASCPNASAALFTAAKISHLVNLPQGHPERARRVRNMVEAMDTAGFGNCSNHGECQAVCPKEISIQTIAVMRREYLRSITFDYASSRDVAAGSD